MTFRSIFKMMSKLSQFSLVATVTDWVREKVTDLSKERSTQPNQENGSTSIPFSQPSPSLDSSSTLPQLTSSCLLHRLVPSERDFSVSCRFINSFLFTSVLSPHRSVGTSEQHPSHPETLSQHNSFSLLPSLILLISLPYFDINGWNTLLLLLSEQ